MTAIVGEMFLEIIIFHCLRVCYVPCNFGCDQSVIKDIFLTLFGPLFDIKKLKSMCGLFQSCMLFFFELVETQKLRDWLVCDTAVLKMRFPGHLGGKMVGQNRPDRVDREEATFHNRELNQKLMGVMIEVLGVAQRIGI